MRRQVFRRRSRLEAPADEVFRWHARPGAFERLNPPWDPAEVSSRTGGIEEEGSRVVVVDDVVTTGGSTLAAIEAAEAAGLEVVAVVCLVDREEGGSDKLSRWPFHPIFVRSEVFVEPPSGAQR